MDYYKILQIDKNSSTKEIKKHYYKLAKTYHPDKNNGISDENFKRLSEAYSVLSNPKKRYLYDMKLLFKENLGEDFINHFSDIELDDLTNSYAKAISHEDNPKMTIAYSKLFTIEKALTNLKNSLSFFKDWSYLFTFLPKDIKDTLELRSAYASHFVASLELAKEGHVSLKQNSKINDLQIMKNN